MFEVHLLMALTMNPYGFPLSREGKLVVLKVKIRVFLSIQGASSNLKFPKVQSSIQTSKPVTSDPPLFFGKSQVTVMDEGVEFQSLIEEGAPGGKLPTLT